MSLKEKIMCELKKENYLSDRELTDKILGTSFPQQSVNACCRQLQKQGLLKRTSLPIKNYISTENDLITKDNADYNKIVYLKNEFNQFWNKFWDTDMDYYENFTIAKLNELKLVVSSINNLITFESTIMAANLICDILKLEPDKRAFILNNINNTSSNSNGFDIIYTDNNLKNSFICEVKANTPAGGKSVFGANQKEQIEKDINSLLKGKTKSDISTNNYYKFLAMYCESNITLEAIHDFANKRSAEVLELWRGQESLDKTKVYIILVQKEA